MLKLPTIYSSTLVSIKWKCVVLVGKGVCNLC